MLDAGKACRRALADVGLCKTSRTKQTFNKEQMSGRILRIICVSEVRDDTVDVLVCGHQEIQGLKFWLGLSTRRDSLDDWK